MSEAPWTSLADRSPGDEQARVYRELGQTAEAKTDAAPVPLEREDLAAQADFIAMTIAKHPRALDGMREAHVEYIQKEPRPELKEFGRMLLRSPFIAASQAELDRLQDKERGGSALTDVEIATKNEMANATCEYNQQVYAFVARYEELITPELLQGWLGRASGHETAWAGRVVSAVRAERAAWDLLQEVPEVLPDSLRHGNVAEDRQGKDFVFQRTARGFDGIDVKTGEHRPAEPVSVDPKTEKLVLSLDPGHLTGFRVKGEYKLPYISQLRQYLSLT